MTDISGNGTIVYLDKGEVPELRIRGVRLDNFSYVPEEDGRVYLNGVNLTGFAKKLEKRNKQKRNLFKIIAEIFNSGLFKNSIK